MSFPLFYVGIIYLIIKSLFDWRTKVYAKVYAKLYAKKEADAIKRTGSYINNPKNSSNLFLVDKVLFYISNKIIVIV